MILLSYGVSFWNCKYHYYFLYKINTVSLLDIINLRNIIYNIHITFSSSLFLVTCTILYGNWSYDITKLTESDYVFTGSSRSEKEKTSPHSPYRSNSQISELVGNFIHIISGFLWNDYFESVVNLVSKVRAKTDRHIHTQVRAHTLLLAYNLDTFGIHKIPKSHIYIHFQKSHRYKCYRLICKLYIHMCIYIMYIHMYVCM